MIRLGDVVKVQAGQAAPKEFSADGLPFIRAGHLEDLIKGGSLDELPKITDEIATQKKLKLLPQGSILFAKSGMSATKDRVYVTDKRTYFVSHLAAILPSKTFDTLYLAYYLKWFKPSTLIIDEAYPSIRLSDISDLKIPLPPLAEQQKIAEILDAADSLRQKDQQLIDHYTTLSQSLFLEMFGDPVTNPMGWDKKHFLDVFNVTTGKLDSNAASDTGNYPFFTCAKEELKINTYSYDHEALLLAGNNAAGIFDVKYYKGKFDAYQRTYILTIKEDGLIYPFMKIALEKKLKDLQRLSIGSSTQYLTMKILGRLDFFIPLISIQNQFAKRIEAIETQKQQAQASLEKSNDLFNSLLQRAFNGELTGSKAA